MSSYDYLVLIDWELSGTSLDAPDQTEIVEWSFMLYDVAKREQLNPFQFFIPPQNHALLTPEFYQRTGLTPELFFNNPNAVTLAQAIQTMDEHLLQTVTSRSKTFCLCVLGPLKLRDYLRSDASKKGVKLGRHYSTYFDLCEEYSKWKSAPATPSVHTLLEEICAPLRPGQRLTGVDGVMILLSVATFLANQDYPFKTPHTISAEYTADWTTPPRTVHPTDPSFNALVRIRGLPWQVDEAQVRRFFGTHKPRENGILLVTGADGRMSGEAFVRFDNQELAKASLDRHKQYIGQRYIEVFEASQAELEALVSRPAAAPLPNLAGEDLNFKGVIRLRGLPWSATQEELLEFFASRGHPVHNNEIVIGLRNDGKPSGEAYALFASEDAAKAAREACDKQTLGARYLELFASCRGEMLSQQRSNASGTRTVQLPAKVNPANQTEDADRPERAERADAPAPAIKRPASPPQKTERPAATSSAAGASETPATTDGPTKVLRLRGLPFDANENDIMSFFTSFPMVAVLPSTAPIDGRPTGEAYVEFQSIADAKRAMNDKHRQKIGKRYIELFYASHEEMMDAANGKDVREIRKTFGSGPKVPGSDRPAGRDYREEPRYRDGPSYRGGYGGSGGYSSGYGYRDDRGYGGGRGGSYSSGGYGGGYGGYGGGYGGGYERGYERGYDRGYDRDSRGGRGGRGGRGRGGY